jgi:hypothetical protein
VVDGAWWVLRVNHGFPEHDLLTLFVDGEVLVDITPGCGASPFETTLAGLRPLGGGTEAALDPESAGEAIGPVAEFADYGSEHGDPCIFCSGDADGRAPA